MNPITSGRRHFEDLAVGEVLVLASVTVTREMIISFAREFDPLPFHLDEEAAKASLLGGLAASGWQTAALSLRLLNDAFLGHVASAGGLGFSDLKWRRPVLAGDTIGGTATIVALRLSQSHPEWGIAEIDFDISNHKGERAMTMRLANLIERREVLMTQPQQPYDTEHGSGRA
jgi:acyl dehydratase